MLKKRNDSGQIALILVLIMTVVGTAAISLAGRTVVETRVQEVNIDSSQAMLAAEAGLEQALKLSPAPLITGSLDANTAYSVTDQTTGTSNAIIGPFKNGEIWEINLTGFTGNLNLYWDSSPTPGQARGLYISSINSSGIEDVAYAGVPNPAAEGTFPGFSFISPGANSLGGSNFSYKTISVPYTAGSSTLRVMMLGGDTILGFEANGDTLVEQVRIKTSTGTVTRGSGLTAESTRQGLGYYESVTDQVPAVFDYALYSGTTIVQ